MYWAPTISDADVALLYAYLAFLPVAAAYLIWLARAIYKDVLCHE